jgi:hypothetical protein
LSYSKKRRVRKGKGKVGEEGGKGCEEGGGEELGRRR